jgi:hypothetical protein
MTLIEGSPREHAAQSVRTNHAIPPPPTPTVETHLYVTDENRYWGGKDFI